MSDRHYEIYALTDDERIVLHDIEDRKTAYKVLKEVRRSFKQGRYTPAITTVGITKCETHYLSIGVYLDWPGVTDGCEKVHWPGVTNYAEHADTTDATTAGR